MNNTLYRVSGPAGIIAYAATVDFEDGFWFAGSASGPLAGYTTEAVKVGDRFDHWNYGPVVIKRINQVTISLLDADGNVHKMAL